MCIHAREYVRVIALCAGAADLSAAPCIQQEQCGRGGALTLRDHEFEVAKHVGGATTANEPCRGAQCRRDGVAREERGAGRHH